MITMTSLHFTETMRGFISEKELRDHDLGAKLGRRDKRRFEFTVTIRAKDLNRFLQDPKHEAALTGTVNYEPLGAACGSNAAPSTFLQKRVAPRR